MASTDSQMNSHPYGPSVGRLIDEFERLPGIGRKSAERLANYILSCSSRDANDLADAIREVKTSVQAMFRLF